MSNLDIVFQTIKEMHLFLGTHASLQVDSHISIIIRKTRTNYRFDSKAIASGFMSRKDKFEISVFYRNSKILYMETHSWNEGRCWLLEHEGHIRKYEGR